MAELGPKKGTITALGSLFPAEEAQKASKRVHVAIADRRGELDRLKAFVADNSDLIKLVRQLPDEISHEIMVPFGSAAFFPGRLIHTNEFLALLGDGYYAERTSKQTVEILKRREKSLDSQVEALNASLLDLEAEAKFFASTAAEAKEGIVEIREEYTEEPQIQQEDIIEIREEYTEEPQKEFESGVSDLNFVNTSVLPNKEDEHARIMARLDELEKEELDAENASGSDQDEDPESGLEADSASGSDEDEDSEADFGFSKSQNYVNDDKGKTVEKLNSVEPVQMSRGQDLLQSTAKPIVGGSQQHLSDLSISDSNSKFLARDKPLLHPDPKEDLYNFSNMKLEDSSDNVASKTGKIGYSERKAFTGSVIEHTHGLQSDQPAKSTSTNQPTKPVSRFKMMKDNR